MTGFEDTASAIRQNAVCDECAAKIARKYLFAANRLALVMRRCKAESVALAFRDLALVCQLFWRWGEFRTGPDGQDKTWKFKSS